MTFPSKMGAMTCKYCKDLLATKIEVYRIYSKLDGKYSERVQLPAKAEN